MESNMFGFQLISIFSLLYHEIGASIVTHADWAGYGVKNAHQHLTFAETQINFTHFVTLIL
jgi:hypothetical protein